MYVGNISMYIIYILHASTLEIDAVSATIFRKKTIRVHVIT